MLLPKPEFIPLPDLARSQDSSEQYILRLAKDGKFPVGISVRGCPFTVETEEVGSERSDDGTVAPMMTARVGTASQYSEIGQLNLNDIDTLIREHRVYPQLLWVPSLQLNIAPEGKVRDDGISSDDVVIALADWERFENTHGLPDNEGSVPAEGGTSVNVLVVVPSPEREGFDAPRRFASEPNLPKDSPVTESEETNHEEGETPEVGVLFPDLHGLKWKEIKIAVLAHDMVQIDVRGQHQKSHFARLGLAKHGDRPRKSWETLLALASLGGELSWRASSLKQNERNQVKVRISELRKRLRQLFKIEDDPFYDYRERNEVKSQNSYKTKFKLVDARHSKNGIGAPSNDEDLRAEEREDMELKKQMEDNTSTY